MNNNALKHGCCAIDALLLPHENAADLQSLENTWTKEFAPQTDTERHLVQELVHADWFLQRATKTLLEIEKRLYTEKPNPLDWSESEQRTVGRFTRYRTAHANAVAKCRKAIEDHRKTKTNEKILAEKLKTATNKNAPEPTWQEHLELMTKQAIELGYTPPTEDEL